MNCKVQIINCNKRRRGMAMLSVLFIVFAVVVVAMGYLYRSDMALACGQNMNLRNQSDYLAWAGLEYGRAVIQSYETPDPNLSSLEFPYTWDSKLSCELIIVSTEPNVIDPNDRIYTYEVTSEAWRGTDKQARSFLRANICYHPDDPNGLAEFVSISRQ